MRYTIDIEATEDGHARVTATGPNGIALAEFDSHERVLASRIGATTRHIADDYHRRRTTEITKAR